MDVPISAGDPLNYSNHLKSHFTVSAKASQISIYSRAVQPMFRKCRKNMPENHNFHQFPVAFPWFYMAFPQFPMAFLPKIPRFPWRPPAPRAQWRPGPPSQRGRGSFGAPRRVGERVFSDSCTSIGINDDSCI